MHVNEWEKEPVGELEETRLEEMEGVYYEKAEM